MTDALDRVGLSAQAGAEAGDLAYGHQRLLELAMGIVQRPRLLILDEPTQGLSDGEIAGFEALIRDLARTTTILLIEHNMRVVMALAQRITVLEAGACWPRGRRTRSTPTAVQAAYLGGSPMLRLDSVGAGYGRAQVLRDVSLDVGMARSSA